MKTYEKSFTAILLFLCFLVHGLTSFAQSDRNISEVEQKQIIDKVFALLNTNYIFPDKVVAMEKVIYKKLSNSDYRKFSELEEFLKNINTDLETLSGDRHIDIFFDPVRVKQIEAEAKVNGNKTGYAPEFLQRAKFENYLVKKVERLDANVGYLKFNAFVDTGLSKRTLTASMDFLINSSALIIDLRQNGGGDGGTVAFLLTYFLPDSTLISLERSRATTVPIPHYVVSARTVEKFDKNIPVYILVSKKTSSAAEAFAYTLQSYKRATIVGETTNGEANPGYLYPINNDMYIMIPAFESINPITKTNWQGKGVMPDVQIQGDKALAMAQVKAYKTLAQVTEVPEHKTLYDWLAIGLEAELQPLFVTENELKSFEGEFSDNRHISFANGTLYYYRGDNANVKKKLIPLKPDLFGVEELPFFRIHFIKNERHEVVILEGIYDDGKKEASKKL